MECPFCAETIKDEAVVCKHCNRDLRVALPVIAEIQETVLELDRLQRQLDRANTSLAPATLQEWRETFEYGLSSALAFLTGNILVILVLYILPSTIASSGKPNAAAYRMARMLGQHVGQETMRRRARRIQDLMQTVGPLLGVVATAAGSIYTGLKGVFGH